MEINPKINKKKVIFRLSLLPFDIGFYDKRDRRLPMFLPFELSVNKASGLIFQKVSPVVRRALQIYYTLGGYASTPLGEGSYGKRQGDEVFELLKKSFAENGRRVKGASFLEIGAGYGYLLYLLKKAGAGRVLGLEPGDEGATGAKKYDISMLREFFPTEKIMEKFDCVFSYGVLEHIENPLAILKETRKILKNNGIIFAAVPDCHAKLTVGDPSIISHQHVNYFTAESMANLLRESGFDEIKIERYPPRAMLIASAVKRRAPSVGKFFVPDSNKLLVLFRKNLKSNMADIQKLIDSFERAGKTVGFYGAGCSVLRGLIKINKEPRLFDGDSIKHGKHIAGFKETAESPRGLSQNPPDALFITPIDYDQEIKHYLDELDIGGKSEVISLKEIFERNSGFVYSPAGLKRKT